jgi:hypothetical protein
MNLSLKLRTFRPSPGVIVDMATCELDILTNMAVELEAQISLHAKALELACERMDEVSSPDNETLDFDKRPPEYWLQEAARET